MKIDGARLRGPAIWLGLPFAAWTLYWAGSIWTEVRAATAVGQGLPLRDVTAHDIFQLLFVAAHGGIRWMAGVALLLLLGLAAFLWVRRPARVRLRGDRRTVSVTGD